ncbi:MAG: hypothetical protein NTW04_00330, partial [Elusimicrobia bacterium]|nr:hypothetical protein [Elusimicrobiota bacterium]
MNKPIKNISQNQIIGNFSAQSLYLNHLNKPMGARFKHLRTGLMADVLYFNCVPQASICFNTLPVSDMGEPHALEHIVLGKGAKGKHLSILFDMLLGENTAATYPELTVYQFNTIAGMEEFYRLLKAFLDALITPDFCDEEAEREIYRICPVRDPKSGKISLEEKGTIYNEMTSSMEKASSVNWQQAGARAFGKNHPLAKNHGGDPDKIRNTRAKDIKMFHRANYKIGPNMSAVFALPQYVSAEKFLARLGKIIENTQKFSPGRRAKLPPFNPASPLIKIGEYPSEDLSAPQNILTFWPPLKKIGMRDFALLSAALEILGGGETSYLYADLVDGKTRKTKMPVTSINAFLDEPPANLAGFYIGGISAKDISQKKLSGLRKIISRRIGWLCRLKDNSPEIAECKKKALSLLSARRRLMLNIMDNAPHFGDRGGGVFWHKHFFMLNGEKGFKKSIPQTNLIDDITKEIKSGKNVWRRVLQKYGLLKPFSISAVKPNPALIEKQKRQKIKRLALAKSALLKRSHADEKTAFESELKKYAETTKQLENIGVSSEKPSFVENPPLTLDEGIKFSEKQICGSPLILCSAGETSFSDISFNFDISKTSARELVYLPLLAHILAGAGVKTAGGETLNYSQMIERRREEIFSLGSCVSANPNTGRIELCVSA